MNTRILLGCFLALSFVGCGEGAGDTPSARTEPTLITYMDRTHGLTTVGAYPGFVRIWMDPTTPVETVIPSHTKFVEIPEIGYYLVEVPVGAEAAFIDLWNADPRVEDASPYVASHPTSAVLVGQENFGTGDHNSQVKSVVENWGGSVDYSVDAPPSISGGVPTPVIGKVHGQISNKDPNESLLLLVTSAGGREQIDAQPQEWGKHMGDLYRQLAAYPEGKLQGMGLIASAGNSGLDLNKQIAQFKANPKLKNAMEHVMIVGSSRFPASNRGPCPPFVQVENVESELGTSFAAARMLAMVQKIVKVTKGSVELAYAAIFRAAKNHPENVVDETEAILQAQVLMAASLSLAIDTENVRAVGQLDTCAENVAISYSITATDGYTGNGSVSTDASGTVFIPLPDDGYYADAPPVTMFSAQNFKKETYWIRATVSATGKTAERSVYRWLPGGSWLEASISGGVVYAHVVPAMKDVDISFFLVSSNGFTKSKLVKTDALGLATCSFDLWSEDLWRYAMTGEPSPTYEVWVKDMITGQEVKVKYGSDSGGGA